VSVEAISQAVEYIERRLCEAVTVAEVAHQSGFSLYHFCRMFNQVAHLPPYEYLLRRRLAEAGRELALTPRTITAVAFDYQFNNVETFGRAFKRVFGVLPNQWRRAPLLDERHLMPAFSHAYLQHINRPGGLCPALVERAEVRLSGLATPLADEQAALDLWGALAGQIPPQSWPCGVVLYPSAARRFYLAAWEGETPAGAPWVAYTLPAGRYARFVHAGARSGLGLTRQYIYHTWLPRNGRQAARPFELETYPAWPDVAGRVEVLIPIL